MSYPALKYTSVLNCVCVDTGRGSTQLTLLSQTDTSALGPAPRPHGPTNHRRSKVIIDVVKPLENGTVDSKDLLAQQSIPLAYCLTQI